MKNIVFFFFTILTEILILAGLARFFNWKFIDIMLLGGVLIFGLVWLLKLYSNQSRNQYNAFSSIDYKENLKVTPFYLKVSPFILGLIVFNLVSLVITIAVYAPYFIN